MRVRAAAVLLVLCAPAASVDHAKFRTCDKTSFCRRHRKADATRPWLVAPGTAALDAAGKLSAQLHGGPFGVPLTLVLQGYASGSFRLRITETKPLHGPRWEPDDILMDPVAAPLVLLDAAGAAVPEPLRAALSAGDAVAYILKLPDGSAPSAILALHLHPFRAALHVAGEAVVELNPGGKFYFEHHRAKGGNVAALPAAAVGEDLHKGKTIVDYGEDGLAVYSDGTKQERTSSRRRSYYSSSSSSS